MVQVTNIVVHRCGSVAERLLKIFFFEERIFPKNLFSLSMSSENFKYSSDGDSHPANAGLAPTLAGLDGDPVKRWIQNHTTSLPAPPIHSNPKLLVPHTGLSPRFARHTASAVASTRSSCPPDLAPYFSRPPSEIVTRILKDRKSVV